MQIDEDVLRLIIRQESIVLVGSVSPEGIPNISPRYVLDIIRNEKLLFADAFENKTFHNISSWPKVAVAVFDKDAKGGGYQLKGQAEEVVDLELIKHAEAKLKDFGIDSVPKKVWLFSLKEIYSLLPSAKSRQPLSFTYG